MKLPTQNIKDENNEIFMKDFSAINSEMKFSVNGNPIFPKDSSKVKVENIGIVIVKPL